VNQVEKRGKPAQPTPKPPTCEAWLAIAFSDINTPAHVHRVSHAVDETSSFWQWMKAGEATHSRMAVATNQQLSMSVSRGAELINTHQPHQQPEQVTEHMQRKNPDGW
jgi:hypothetical protein